MRWLRKLLCCILALAGAVTASASQNKPVKSDQEILIELEQRWNEAFYHKNLSFIQSVLADEFIATYDDGTRGNKAKELELAASFNQHVESSIQDEFTVKVYKDTAVGGFQPRRVGGAQGPEAQGALAVT